MNRALSALIALGISLGLAIAVADPVLGFAGWATERIDELGAAERGRQQEIQDLVCEASGTPADCGTVPAWVPAHEQIAKVAPESISGALARTTGGAPS